MVNARSPLIIYLECFARLGSLLHHSFQFPLCFKTTLLSSCVLITITLVQLVVYSSAIEHCFYGKEAILNAIHYHYYYYRNIEAWHGNDGFFGLSDPS